MGHIYLLELGDGVLKVGLTNDPERRLVTHRQALARRGRAVISEWLSPWHYGVRSNENDMIHALTVLASRVDGREWFAGVPMDVALGMAMTLDFGDILRDYEARTRKSREGLNACYARAPGLKERVEALVRPLPPWTSVEARLLIIVGLEGLTRTKGGGQ